MIYGKIIDGFYIVHFYSLQRVAISEQEYLSQAAACDGTLITTSAENQEVVPGTLPTF